MLDLGCQPVDRRLLHVDFEFHFRVFLLQTLQGEALLVDLRQRLLTPQFSVFQQAQFQNEF